jgi:hypothetical protein
MAAKGDAPTPVTVSVSPFGLLMESINGASPHISIGAELPQWCGVEGSAVSRPTRVPRAVRESGTEVWIEFLLWEKTCWTYLLG